MIYPIRIFSRPLFFMTFTCQRATKPVKFFQLRLKFLKWGCIQSYLCKSAPLLLLPFLCFATLHKRLSLLTLIEHTDSPRAAGH
jgi:hypothetical protein